MDDAVTEAVVEAVSKKKGVDRVDPVAIRKYIVSIEKAEEEKRLYGEHISDLKKSFKADGVPVGDVDRMRSALKKLHALKTNQEEVPVLMSVVSDVLGYQGVAPEQTYVDPPDDGDPEE